MAREKNVLTCLGHNTVGRGNDENGAVHLRCAGDHIFDVVRMTRTVDVSVVPIAGLILDVSDIDCHASFSLLRSLVDLVIRQKLCPALFFEDFGYCGGQRRLPVVDVANRTYVQMGLFPLKLRFAHLTLLFFLSDSFDDEPPYQSLPLVNSRAKSPGAGSNR